MWSTYWTWKARCVQLDFTRLWPFFLSMLPVLKVSGEYVVHVLDLEG